MQISNEPKQLAPGILVYEEAFSDIDYLNQLIMADDLDWFPGLISANRDAEESINNTAAKLNTDIRDCLSIPMPYDRSEILDLMSENPDNHMIPRYLAIYDAIKPMFDGIEKDYLIRHNIDYMTWHSRLELLKYGPGHFFDDHIDSVPGINRTVSVVYYLNDSYSGGEINFHRFDLKVKPRANSMIVFPSNYVYNHTAESVNSGIKYAIASFLA